MRLFVPPAVPYRETEQIVKALGTLDSVTVDVVEDPTTARTE